MAQASYVYQPGTGIFSSFETPTTIALKSEWAAAMGLGGMMFWDITNDALDSSESLVKAAYDSWVLDEDFATIRDRSSLTDVIIVGGDGLLGAAPAAGVSPTAQAHRSPRREPRGRAEPGQLAP